MTTCRYTGRPPSIEAGIELDRATLASWVREAAALLQPLSDALGGYVRAADKIHTDDTPVPVLEPGRGKTRTARLWTYVRDDRPAGSHAPPAVWYRYSPDRKGERPQEHLAGYTGILQADAFSGLAAPPVAMPALAAGEAPAGANHHATSTGVAGGRAWRSAHNGQGPWWNAGARHMVDAFPKRYFDRQGLVSLLDTQQRLQRS